VSQTATRKLSDKLSESNLTDHDDVLTNPIFPPHEPWSWTSGMDHDPEEPSSVLLPGRVDQPASNVQGSTAVGQFGSASAAAAAANALSGICVAATVILPVSRTLHHQDKRSSRWSSIS
jgi:hypothetical protein